MAKTLNLGITDLSFHRVTGALVTYVLQGMGFDVQRHYAPHEANFDALQQGSIDMLASAWLPSSHGQYRDNVAKQVPLLELGLHYQPYALWGVPDYVPEEWVTEVADLCKPEVVANMASRIQGINPGAGISRFSQAIIREYGLAAHGYQFFTGTEADCFGYFEQAVAKQQWLVVPLWQPQYLHFAHAIRTLHEPKGLLGSVDRAVLLLREDRKDCFSEQQLAVLQQLKFGNPVISELDYRVAKQGLSFDEAANRWWRQQ